MTVVLGSFAIFITTLMPSFYIVSFVFEICLAL